MLNKLQINNFRNYITLKLSLQPDKRIVVLYGKNGIGKTNILESISLLYTSHGLRKARYDDMINNKGQQHYWNITAETDNGEFSSGYIKNDNAGKRIYKINGKNVRNLNEFRKDNRVLWMTYETDRLFMQSPSERRDFIDMFCDISYPQHSDALKDYEKLTRERLKILKQFCENGANEAISKWLDIVEEKIADLGIKIAKTRSNIATELEKFQIRNGEFPLFHSRMFGRVEEEILAESNCNELYKLKLKTQRQKDAFSGSTTFGANRSDWVVFHEEKQINAEQCSAGEQKMLILAVFFDFILQHIKTDNRNLIILLDDVITHLDTEHRNLLFRYINSFVQSSNDVSVWLSGTDKELFHELEEHALFFDVSNINTGAEERS